ncbi:MAG TPA: riboflavin biosynthesis protein RibF [Thermomicrobiales bacterium]|jgi:riboflavin kinase/FMN adenylyltransferase|nr:riboflavin biosynthesis protein RibF [Thermomicrobiales bacterium]
MADNGQDNQTTFVTGLDDLPRVPRVVTIGTFDGVHRGHEYLIDTTVARARELAVRSLAITFEPIPAMVLRPDAFPGRICSMREKLDRLGMRGLDEVCVIPFGRDFSGRTAEAFIAELVELVAPIEILTGEAFALGRGRAGNIERLTELGREHGYTFRALERVSDGGEVISSSAIRQAVIHGDPAKAARYLGRPFRVSGPVVHSSHYGRQIGFPTANVMPDQSLVPVADGIYVSLASIGREPEPRAAMTYVGTRPTVNTGARQMETHLLDFDGDLYGHTLHVDLLHRLRPDEHFPDVESMVEQLREDEHATRRYLAAREANGPGTAAT